MVRIISSTSKSQKECPPGTEFVFVNPGAGVVGKAKNLKEFKQIVSSAPLSSVLYHANGGHFSPWLNFIGEKNLAKTVISVKGNSEQVRSELLRVL